MIAAPVSPLQWFVLGFVFCALLGALWCSWWANRKGDQQ
jgi:hypothetical protein